MKIHSSIIGFLLILSIFINEANGLRCMDNSNKTVVFTDAERCYLSIKYNKKCETTEIKMSSSPNNEEKIKEEGAEDHEHGFYSLRKPGNNILEFYGREMEFDGSHTEVEALVSRIAYFNFKNISKIDDKCRDNIISSAEKFVVHTDKRDGLQCLNYDAPDTAFISMSLDYRSCQHTITLDKTNCAVVDLGMKPSTDVFPGHDERVEHSSSEYNSKVAGLRRPTIECEFYYESSRHVIDPSRYTRYPTYKEPFDKLINDCLLHYEQIGEIAPENCEANAQKSAYRKYCTIGKIFHPDNRKRLFERLTVSATNESSGAKLLLVGFPLVTIWIAIQ